MLGIFFMVTASSYPMGSMAQPGAGVFPLFVGALLLLSSIGIGLEVRSKPALNKLEWPKERGGWRLLTLLGGIVAFIILLRYIGYLPASAVLTLLALHAMEMRSWLLKIGITLAFSLASYFLFAILLGVPLP